MADPFAELDAYAAQRVLNDQPADFSELDAYSAQHGFEAPPAPTGLQIEPDPMAPPVLAGISPPHMGQLPFQGIGGEAPAAQPQAPQGTPLLETGFRSELNPFAQGLKEGRPVMPTFNAEQADVILRSHPQSAGAMKDYDFAREVLGNWGLPNLLPDSKEISQAVVNMGPSAVNFLPMMAGFGLRAVEATSPTATQEQRDAFIEEAKNFGKAIVTLPLAAAEPALTGRVWMPGSVPGQGYPGAKQAYAFLEDQLGTPINLESWVEQFKQDPIMTTAMTLGPAAAAGAKGAGLLDRGGGGGGGGGTPHRPLSRIRQVEEETLGQPHVGEFVPPEARPSPEAAAPPEAPQRPPRVSKAEQTLEGAADILNVRALPRGFERALERVQALNPQQLFDALVEALGATKAQARREREAHATTSDPNGIQWARAYVARSQALKYGPDLLEPIQTERRVRPRAEPTTAAERPVETPRGETAPASTPPEVVPQTQPSPPAEVSAPSEAGPKVSERAPEPGRPSPTAPAEAPAPAVPAADINALEAELAQKHGTSRLLEMRKQRGEVPDEQYVARLRDYMEKNKGKEKAPEEAPAETGPMQRNYMKGERVQWGQKRRFVQDVREENGEQWVLLPTKSTKQYTLKSTPKQWVRVSELTDVNEARPVKGRKAKPIEPPESPKADPERFTAWLVQEGGLAKNDSIIDNTKEVAGNWARGKEKGRMRLVRETGSTIEDIAADNWQRFSADFKSASEMVEWLRDEWALGPEDRPKTKGQRPTNAFERDLIEDRKKDIRKRFGQEAVDNIEAGLQAQYEAGGALSASEVDIWDKAYESMMHDAKLKRRQARRDELRGQKNKGKPGRKKKEKAEAPEEAAPAEPERPTMEEAARAVDEAKAKREAREKAEAKAEKKRQADAERKQGSLTDEETNRRIAEEEETAKKKAEFESKQTTIPKGGGEPPNLSVSPARQALRRKLFALHSGLDPTIVADLVKAAVAEAKRLRGKSKDKIARYSDFETTMRSEAAKILAAARAAGKKAPRNLSPQLTKRLWNQPEVRLEQLSRTGAVSPGRPAASPRAELAAFRKEMGGERGEKIYTEERRKMARIGIGMRALADDVARQFKKVSKAGEFALWWTHEGMRAAKDGPEYGAIVRAGTERPQKAPEGGVLAPAPGTLMPDGRVSGPILPDGRQQFYRVIFQDEAKARHDYLKKEYPEAAKVLDQLLATQEDPIFTRAGDRLPSRSQLILKEREGIEGLTKEEAIAASSLIKEAYGPAAEGKVIPQEFSLVPESGLVPRTGFRRLRNALREVRASSRYYKTGSLAEALRKAYAKGEKPVAEYRQALLKQRAEFLQEEIHNQVAASIFQLAAERIKDVAEWNDLAKNGYVEFSRSGLFGNSVKFRRFLQKHKEFLEDAGIDVPEAMSASYIAGGKGYKIPKRVAEKLGAFFEDRTSWTTDAKTRELHESVARMFDETVSFINAARLTRPSSAMRNLVANNAALSVKIYRDFYRGMLDVIVPGNKTFEMPMADFIGDIQALIETPLGRYDPRAWFGKGKDLIERMPPEMLGETFLDVLGSKKPGKLRQFPGFMLRHVTGFQAMDIYTKRLIRESVVNAHAAQAWKVAERKGLTGGKTKAQFIQWYKDGIPPEIDALAYREMDMWGGYDYGNIPQSLRKAKKSPWFRATVPYPTYYYKLLQTYREVYGWHNFKTMFDPKATRGAQLNAIANVMAGATMAALAWKIVDAMTEWDLPQGMDVKNIPYDVQTYGRLRLPWIGDDDGSFWVRLSDVPFIGEVLAGRAIWGGNMGFNSFLNERVSLGPLFNLGLIYVGASDRYNQNMEPESRLGKEVGSWIPGANELQFARRVVDPWKRETSRKGDATFKNLMAPVVDNLPWLSSLLDRRTDVYRLGRPKYNPWEAVGSYSLLNVHFIDKEARQRGIKIAKLMHERELSKEWKRDRLGKLIDESGLDKLGRTEAGQLKGARKSGITADVDLEFMLRERAVTEAFDEEGPQVAIAEARSLVEDIEDRMVRMQVLRRLANMVKRLAKSKAMGLTRQEIRRTPKYARPQLMQELERIRAEAQ